MIKTINISKIISDIIIIGIGVFSLIHLSKGEYGDAIYCLLMFIGSEVLSELKEIKNKIK